METTKGLRISTTTRSGSGKSVTGGAYQWSFLICLDLNEYIKKSKQQVVLKRVKRNGFFQPSGFFW